VAFCVGRLHGVLSLAVRLLADVDEWPPPGDASADQLDMVADLADRFSAGEARVTHEQNVVLPWVHADDLFPLWKAACDADLASANVRLLANDADPTTLADRIGEIARVDLHFPHFTDGLLR
jgi:hypothetical protein